jgi:hypothetical protein
VWIVPLTQAIDMEARTSFYRAVSRGSMVTFATADFKALFPEFSDTPNSAITVLIPLANSFVNENQWGEVRAVQAVQLLVAHFLKELGTGSDPGDIASDVSGPVTMEKVGDISRSYGALNTSAKYSAQDQAFLTTTYGKTYVMLKKTVGSTPLVV